MDSESYNARLVYHFDEESKLSITAGRNNHSFFGDAKPDAGDRDETSWSLGYENQVNERNLLKVSYIEKEEEKTSVMSLFPKYRGSNFTAELKQFEIQNSYQMSEKDLLTIGYASIKKTSFTIMKLY